ncbi:MAG: S8/S53 family peptidase [Acidobacteriaceae bacterium]|nr:S8/S53 family peptidase [Acidobacteriaceae bacterium]
MSSHIILPGSYREHPAKSIPVGDPISGEVIQITLLLRRRTTSPEPHLADNHLSHAELADRYGADPADIEAVEAFATENHFSVVHVNPAARSITLSGKLAALAAAFGADLQVRWSDGKHFRSRTGHLLLPSCLSERVIAVLGFDQRPLAQTSHRIHARSAQPVSYTPTQLTHIYNFPQNTGANQTIALIELGGGFKNSDLQTYWKQLGLSNVSVTAVSVDGAQNAPTGDPDGPDGEVALDIEVAGGAAPGARIAVYFAPNTDQGFLNAINGAIHDNVRKPSVIAISWGAAENQWIQQSLDAFNAAFHDAAMLGITVCAAAGDNGSSDGEPDNHSHVDFPASSPWVLACGGTRLIAHNGKITSETVWNDASGGATGGGVSAYFSRPSYQAHLNIPAPAIKSNVGGRGVPDVAAVADPETGYQVLVDGHPVVVGGTSAVAPFWAALIAVCNEKLGKNIGWLHPTLYGTIAQHKVLHDITTGTNGAYKAATGWDCCTGLGSPDGQAILDLLASKK